MPEFGRETLTFTAGALTEKIENGFIVYVHPGKDDFSVSGVSTVTVDQAGQVQEIHWRKIND